MEKTNKILMILIAVVLVGGLGYYFMSSNNTAPSENNIVGDVDIENQMGNENEADLIFEEEYTAEDRLVFENYLNANISSLSAQEAVLGGTFSITNFNWVNNNTAFITYEDGHNMYEAEVSIGYDQTESIMVNYFYDTPVEGVVEEEIMIEEPINEEPVFEEEMQIQILEEEPIQ